MNLLPIGALLVSVAVCTAQSKTDDIIADVNNTNNRSRGLVNILNPFDILKNFKLCSLTCNEKHCSCCQHIPFMLTTVPVCIIANFNVLGGILQIGLSVGPKTIVSTTMSIGSTFHSCKAYQTSLGNLDICADVALNNRNNNPNTFTVHAKAEVTYNKIKAVRVDFNSVNFNGDISLEGKIIDGAKALGSILILNPVALTNELMKFIGKEIINFG